MPYLLPFDNTPSARKTIILNEMSLVFEVNYFPNIQCWLMDIYQPAESDTGTNMPVITGINLRTGVDNLIKGKCELLKGWAINVASLTGKENNTPDSLGNDCFIVVYIPGETVPVSFEDKKLD